MLSFLCLILLRTSLFLDSLCLQLMSTNCARNCLLTHFIKLSNVPYTHYDEIHLFISCRGNDSAEASLKTHLFPIVSKLFQSALHTSLKGSSSAAQAIRDAFLVSRKLIHEPETLGACLSINLTTPVPTLTLPNWFLRK